MDLYFAVVFLLLGWLECCFGETCYAKETTPCYCEIDSEHKKLDIGYYDSYSKSLQTTSGDQHFTFSPCVPFQCNDASPTVQICLYIESSGTYLALGRLSSGQYGNPWMVNSLSPLNFTIQYNGGDEFNGSLLYSTVNIVYSENISMFTFLQSYNEGGNEVYEFQLFTPNITLDDIGNNTKSANRQWIAGAVVGSWVFLVLVLSGIVTVIIYSAVKHDRWKRKGAAEQYQPLPTDSQNNQPT